MIKVVLVDDSQLVREVVKKLFLHIPNMELVATFGNPIDALDFFRVYRPNVVILDMEMPLLDGLSTLERIMQDFPMPVVLFSAYMKKGSLTAIKALELGAVEVVAKDAFTLDEDHVMWDELVNALKCAAASSIDSIKANRQLIIGGESKEISTECVTNTKAKVIVMGASTGGTQALEYVLSQLNNRSLPILIVQHMPAQFTGAFAKRLNETCPLKVREAKDNDPIRSGEVLIAPGNKHLSIVRKKTGIFTQTKAGPPVCYHCPSVDVLFNSAQEVYSGDVLAILMTGMGQDGAFGMKLLNRSGAYTVAQDQSTSVVFGMPSAAIRISAVSKVAPLNEIASIMNKAFVGNKNTVR